MKVLIMHEDRTIDAPSASPPLPRGGCHGITENDVRNVVASRSSAAPYLLRLGASSAGFTLIELIIVSVVIMILATLSVPVYSEYMNRVKFSRCKQEIRTLETEIQAYINENTFFPATLVDIDRATLRDPWGNTYKYRNIENPDGGALATRMRFGVPVNTDFDLYSMGPDGLTEQPVNGGGGTGRDDVIRASDGAYNGRGDEF